MKIIYSSLIALLMLAGMISCKKDNFNYPKDTVGISKVTHFAELNMAGNKYESMVQGETYSDAGVTASQSGNDLPVTVTGSVDGNVVGIYTLTYSATNSDGFPASIRRTVAVLPAAELPGLNLSGSYYYVGSGSGNSTITKLAPGFYSTTNCWSNTFSIPCLFLCVDGANIIMPNQPTAYGELFGTGTLSPDGALTYSVSIPSQGIIGFTWDWHLK